MVEQDAISGFHGIEIIASLIVPHAGPWFRLTGPLFEVVDGKFVRFAFHQPVLHVMSPRAGQASLT